MGLPGFGSPGSIRQIRYSGVLASDELATTLRQLRLMYWYGLRHFKLKVGTPGDRERVEAVVDYLRRPLANGRATLRIDANGAWSKESAIEWLSAIAHLPISAVEQPFPRGSEDELPGLVACVAGVRARGMNAAARIFIHDESLITLDDAQRLIELGVADAFNIRISKCGGLIPSLRIAALARRHNARIQLGCMVGETSILSAAGLRFLEVCPAVTWGEGCFGSFLLSADVAAKALRFGYAGRPPKLKETGLGVAVDPIRLKRLCTGEPVVVNL
jgi:L-Ala-D/L-Glu epimerase